MLLHILVACAFLLPRSILLYEYFVTGFFTHLLMDNLNCFYLGTIMNKVAVNIHVLVFL